MNFKEKLAQISNELEFDSYIAQQCTIIQNAMEKAAREKYRTFQIEIVHALREGLVLCISGAANCHTVLCVSIEKHVIAVNVIEAYLKQLGFEEVHITKIVSNSWLTTTMKVEW